MFLVECIKEDKHVYIWFHYSVHIQTLHVMPPSASAGNRVNRECYMQVRGYGCTTPALVPFCVARL